MSDISAFGITASLRTGWDGRIGQRTDPVGPVPQAPEASAAPEADAAPQQRSGVPVNDVLSSLSIPPR